jgi:hypothetical protein
MAARLYGLDREADDLAVLAVPKPSLRTSSAASP